MADATTPARIHGIRQALDEHLQAARGTDLDALGAGYHADARLHTHEGDVVVGRQAIVQWHAARADTLCDLQVRPEHLEIRSDGVLLDWWAATAHGALAGRGEFVIDDGGLITEQRVTGLGVTDREHRGVRVEVEPPVARIVLDRPEKRNSVSQSMLASMTSAVRDFSSRTDLRAVVLRGEGPTFCAGEDVGGFHFPDEDTARAFLEGPLTFFEELETLPIPVFVAAHGAALGFGSEVLLVVDGVAVAPDTRLGFAEIDHGAVPSVLVTRGLGVLGRRLVADLALTGRRFGPGEGVRVGLVHRVTDDPTAQVEVWARGVSGFDPDAAATIERLVGAGAAADHARARDFMPRVLVRVEVSLP